MVGSYNPAIHNPRLMLATFSGFWWCLEWVQGKCCRIKWYLWVKNWNKIIPLIGHIGHICRIPKCRRLNHAQPHVSWLKPLLDIVGCLPSPPIQLFVESQVVIRPLSRLRLPPLRCDVRLFLASRNSAISRKHCAIDIWNQRDFRGELLNDKCHTFVLGWIWGVIRWFKHRYWWFNHRMQGRLTPFNHWMMSLDVWKGLHNGK